LETGRGIGDTAVEAALLKVVPAASHQELAALKEPRIVTEVPGPKARFIIEADLKVTSPSLPRAYALAPVRGAGVMVEDADGNVFLDFNAGIAVTSTGHAHPKVVKAIQEQAERLLHFSGGDFFLPIYYETCARLAEIAPMAPTRVFLTNSGTEAVEAAMKLARNHTGRQYLISFIGSFHGRTYGSVSLTASKARYHEGFGPLLPGVLYAPYGVPVKDYIDEVIFHRLVPPEEVAAIFVEPIQGEGGYVVPPPGWLQELREACTEHGILLVVDEIQSGMGRTGKMWAVEHAGVEPDILLVGKGIASGMPLAAMVAREDLMTWKKGAHGSTYAGNPVCCAAALATIDLLQKDGLVDNAREMGRLLMEGLEQIARRQSLIAGIRGMGLMIGVEFGDAVVADAVEIACFRWGLLTLRAGDTALRLSPPLVIDADHVRTGLRLFEEACGRVDSEGTEAFIPIPGGWEAGPGDPEVT
jgi:4-aminobutyrate aminotransferase